MNLGHSANSQFEKLERAALSGDPDMRLQWLMALERRNDPRFMATRDFEAQIRQQLASVKVMLIAAMRSDVYREVPLPDSLEQDESLGENSLPPIPDVHILTVARCLRMLFARHEMPRLAHKVAVTVWNNSAGSRPAVDYEHGFDYGFPVPFSVSIMACQIEPGELFIAAGVSRSDQASPGTAWHSLSPWRESYSLKAKLKRIQNWLGSPDSNGSIRIKTECAKLWLEWIDRVAKIKLEPENKPSKKQRGYIYAMRKNKKISDAHFYELLAKHTGLKSQSQLDSRSASAFIAGLKALPQNAELARQKKPKVIEIERPEVVTQWSGRIRSVQPRCRMKRHYNRREVKFEGYSLLIQAPDQSNQSIAVTKTAQKKHKFQVNMEVQGQAKTVKNPNKESVDLYKSSQFKVTTPAISDLEVSSTLTSPPFHGPPPTLDVYQQRKHRRLAETRFNTECRSCIWAARMPVGLIGSDRSAFENRFETACFGPRDCHLYEAGPAHTRPTISDGLEIEPEDVND